MFKTCVTILFSLSFPYAYGQDRDSTEVEHLITVLESAPSFKGDVKAMFHYIKKNIQYPESARRDSLQGIVFVSCWVEPSGRTVDHQVTKGIREDLDEEALRVARSMHFNKPAMKNGKPIKVRYNIPIEFTLNPPRKVRCLRQ